MQTLKLETVSNKLLNTITETQIAKYKELSDQIKELEAMKEKVKKEMLAGFFLENDEYVNSNGRVLATYRAQERDSFNQTKFKEDHNDIYKMYCEKKEVKVFLIK